MGITVSDPAALREELVAALEEEHVVTRPIILKAFRVVPRHLFVPGSSLSEAYRDDVIFTKSEDGISLSASSAPSIMAEMLELLDIRPGQRVLEIGAGTGYNAALLDEITGPAGHVVTLDIDQDVVNAARANLHAAGRADRIILRCADGAHGWPERAPYHRIIVTVGAWDIPLAWFDQLMPGGRVVVPLEFADVHKLVTFERRGRQLVSLDARDCRFVRPRGALAGTGMQLPLSAGCYLSTSRPDVDLASINAALSAGPSASAQLPTTMTPGELHTAFRLWLALSTEDFCLLSLETSALRTSQVRAWETTATRRVVAAGPASTFASVPGLLDDRGVCLLERAADSDHEPILRGYGRAGGLLDRLRTYVCEWDNGRRPFASGLRVDAVPISESLPLVSEPGRRRVAGSLMTEKRWFRYILRSSQPSAANEARPPDRVTAFCTASGEASLDANRDASPAASTASGTDEKYWYISHTPQGKFRPIEQLIEAASAWQPCEGKILDSYDFAALAERSALLAAASRPDLDLVPGDHEDTANTILDILNLSEYRRGPADNLGGIRGQLLHRICARIAANQPIRITIPSFPGRPYNPITHQRIAPDLGEAYAFVLLSRISRHVATVYPPGIHFIICLDGTVYNPFYGYTNEADHQYPRDLQRFIDCLGVQDAVSLVDLQDLVDERADEFQRLLVRMRAEIADAWSRPDYKLRDELIETMKMGANTVALNAAAVYLIKFFDRGLDATLLIERMRAAVADRARVTAFEYMVFLATIREMNLIDTKYPDSIRGTVHPKPGQYSPYLVGPSTTIAPWHGVAVLRADGFIDTVYESEIFMDTQRYTAIYLRGDYTPFYYAEKQGSDGAPGGDSR